MLDLDTAIDLIKQYGYSSTTSHPYVYQNEDSIGICYVYNDEEYGALERIKTFKDIESFEDFLKQLEWLKTNGPAKHVRMILDNYEAMAPKVMYLRNEKLMVEGEMFEIENFDLRESQRKMMDDVSKVIYEAGDLLLVYDEMKGRQLQYLMNIIKLKNSLRQKYYDLQREVDEYNKYKVEREIKLLPEVADSGINETMEIALKDKYNMYIAERPPYEEACEFLKEVWELCKTLELNIKYYDAQKEENDVHNELKIVNQKLELMNRLNDEGRPLFGIDLVGNFRKINKVCMSESTSISQEWINEQVDNIERKYAAFDSLDILNTSDYLREAIQNSNYADLALKYASGTGDETRKARTPLNEVAASLSLHYSNNLTPQEQSVLVLYNNPQYRKLFDAILKVEDFENIPVKKLISIISKTKDYSKIKSIVFDAVKKRLNDPSNDSIKNSLFVQYDFSSYESFIGSVISSLSLLKNINAKMLLNGDINMYLVVNKAEDLNTTRFASVTNALNDLLTLTKGTNSMIGIVLLKENTPVLYSPYYLDIGDVYAKGASLQMAIKEMVNFELLIDCSDVIVNIDPKRTNVVRYYSEPKSIGDVCVVSDIKFSYKTTFCKYAFTSVTAGKEMQEMNAKIDSIQAEALQNANNEQVADTVVANNTHFTESNGNNGTPVVPVTEVAPVEMPVAEPQVAVSTMEPRVEAVQQAIPVVETPATETPVAEAPVVEEAKPVQQEEQPVIPPVQENIVPTEASQPVEKPSEKPVAPVIEHKEIEKSSSVIPEEKPKQPVTPQKVVSSVAKPTSTNTEKPNVVVKPVQQNQQTTKPSQPVKTGQVGQPTKQPIKMPTKLNPGERIVTKIIDGKPVKVLIKPVAKPQGSPTKVGETGSKGTLVKPVQEVKKDIPVDSKKIELPKDSEKKVTDVYSNMELPTIKEKVNTPSDSNKDKMVATPLPVPKVINPEKKQVVVKNVGSAFKPVDSGNSQVVKKESNELKGENNNELKNND